MLKVLKYLRQFKMAVLVVLILLVIQAACDLSLPTYTSDIVDVGIQSSGIENVAPTVIRGSELDKLKMFMSEEDKKIVTESYEILDSSTLNEKELSDYTKKYPILEDAVLYRFKEGSDTEALNAILAKPMLSVLGMSTPSKELTKIKQGILDAGQIELPEGTSIDRIDIFELISKMPSEQVSGMLNSMNQKIDQMPDLIVSQGAITYVKAEYKAIGIDVGKIQSDYLILTGAKMIGVSLLAMLAAIFVTLISAKVGSKLGLNLRGKVFKKVVSFSGAELDNFSTASLITRSTNDIQQVQNFVMLLMRMVFYAPILGIGGVIKVLQTNTSMAWIIGMAVFTILCVIGVLFFVAMPKFKKMQDLVDRVNLVTREILTGLPVVRAFSTERQEEKRFDIANKNLTQNTLFTNRVMTFMMPVMTVIMNAITILIIWVGSKGISQGDMQVGDMMAFMQYTIQIVISFLMLTMVSIIMPRASVAAGRIDEILNTENIILDPENPVRVSDACNGIVKFDNVSFRYPNAEEDVLSEISFTARPGETTAFIGSTGSGKSTLVNLIPRLYDVNQGRILIDEIDIRKMSQHDLRDKLGYVPQKGILFSGTIESNVKYGKPDASKEEVEKAARIAQATEFIEEKTEGYASEIAQGGTNVSGGQKQRLSIARAVAKNPKIYIFDDSFSALDYRTDVTLRRALQEETTKSTVLIVAQRISTILHADQIIVLDEGKIVGIGTHKELLANNEVYQQIATSQLSMEELANE